jgi:hypothetical protein
MTITTFIFWWILRWVLIATAAFYCSLVVTTYAMAGAHYAPWLDPKGAALSIARVLVWGGVQLLDLVIRMLKVVWELLVEASAEAGEWCIAKCSTRVQAQHRLRFL